MSPPCLYQKDYLMPTSWSTFPVNYREICLGFHYLYQQDNHRPKITGGCQHWNHFEIIESSSSRHFLPSTNFKYMFIVLLRKRWQADIDCLHETCADTGTQGFTSAPASIGFKSLQRSCMERKERCMEKLHAIFTRSWGKK